MLREALDLGITFIDTSNVYADGRSEEIVVGSAGRSSAPGYPGHESQLSRGPGCESERRITEPHYAAGRGEPEAIEDRHHRPIPDTLPDPGTPIEETLRALDDLVRQGKVRYIGCSNFSAWQACEAVWTSRTLNLASVVTIQMEYSLLVRDIEREVVPFCQAYQIGIIPYYPLASGLLTGKYRAGEPLPEGTRFATTPRFKDRFLTERNLVLMDRLERFVSERGHTVGELAIAWLLGNASVCSVIAGATKPEQVAANVKAAQWHLTLQEMEEVKALLDRQP